MACASEVLVKPTCYPINFIQRCLLGCLTATVPVTGYTTRMTMLQCTRSLLQYHLQLLKVSHPDAEGLFSFLSSPLDPKMHSHKQMERSGVINKRVTKERSVLWLDCYILHLGWIPSFIPSPADFKRWLSGISALQKTWPCRPVSLYKYPELLIHLHVKTGVCLCWY